MEQGIDFFCIFWISPLFLPFLHLFSVPVSLWWNNCPQINTQVRWYLPVPKPAPVRHKTSLSRSSFLLCLVLNWFLSNDCPIHLSTRFFSNFREICSHLNFTLQPLHCLALRINLSKRFNFSFSLLLLSLAYYFLQHASNSQIKTWQWPFRNCKYWWSGFSFAWVLIVCWLLSNLVWFSSP